MRTGRVVVADIDIDERRADAIERIAESILGVTEWCRYGGSLKRALVYRCDRPIRPGRTAPYRDESGAKFQVEIKGAGNQIVAFGVHPKMKRPYAWEACEPYRNRFDELPATTAEQWKEFDEAAEAYLAEQSDLTRDERAGANCGFGDALYVLTPNTVIEIVRPGREITTYGEICEWIPPDYDAQRSDVWCNAPEEHWPGRRSDSGMVHVFRPHRLAMPVLCDFPRSVTLYAACESPAAREARVMGLEKIAGLLP